MTARTWRCCWCGGPTLGRTGRALYCGPYCRLASWRWHRTRGLALPQRMSAGDALTLRRVRDEGPVTMRALCDTRDKPTVWRSLRRLEAAGLVTVVGRQGRARLWGAA